MAERMSSLAFCVIPASALRVVEFRAIATRSSRMWAHMSSLNWAVSLGSMALSFMVRGSVCWLADALNSYLVHVRILFWIRLAFGFKYKLAKLGKVFAILNILPCTKRLPRY